LGVIVPVAVVGIKTRDSDKSGYTFLGSLIGVIPLVIAVRSLTRALDNAMPDINAAMGGCAK
jgi:hypothetical protein